LVKDPNPSDRVRARHVIVVDAPTVGEEGKMKVLVPDIRTGRFKRCQRTPILAVCQIRTFAIFIEPGERVLRFPLQKDGTHLILLNSLERPPSACGVAAASGDLSLHE
jgi:hypothetical protein